MKPREQCETGEMDLLRSRLDQIINMNHELVRLAKTVSREATLASSPVLQRAWAVMLFLEVGVLVWYQLGAPAYQQIYGRPWPSPGVSLEWAYLLVAVMVAGGSFMFRARA